MCSWASNLSYNSFSEVFGPCFFDLLLSFNFLRKVSNSCRAGQCARLMTLSIITAALVVYVCVEGMSAMSCGDIQTTLAFLCTYISDSTSSVPALTTTCMSFQVSGTAEHELMLRVGGRNPVEKCWHKLQCRQRMPLLWENYLHKDCGRVGGGYMFLYH